MGPLTGPPNTPAGFEDAVKVDIPRRARREASRIHQRWLAHGDNPTLFANELLASLKHLSSVEQAEGAAIALGVTALELLDELASSSPPDAAEIMKAWRERHPDE